MNQTIRYKKTDIIGTITIPASKSVMQRACAAAYLKGGKTILINPGKSNDDQTALNIITQLGAEIKYHADAVEINIPPNTTNAAQKDIDCGESGLSFRMFTTIIASTKLNATMVAHGSLQKRPMHFFNETLPQLGVLVNSNNGFAPISIKGPITPQNITVDGSLSSQYLTGLLLAFAANKTKAKITVNQLTSKPYIDLTLDIIKQFGLNAPKNHQYQEFEFDDQTNLEPFELTYSIEGDWSNAAFWLVAGAIKGNNFKIKGLTEHSFQGDKSILDVINQFGASIKFEENHIEINQSLNRNPFTFNATECPDLFPPLVALAIFANGTSKIKGVHRLKYKESDRAATLMEEFTKLGAKLWIKDDELHIEGTEFLKAAVIDSHNDHRIAMAGAIAAMFIDQEIIIENAEAVNKSYPAFWEDLKNINR